MKAYTGATKNAWWLRARAAARTVARMACMRAAPTTGAITLGIGSLMYLAAR